jgi:lipoyl(octanoyl) transferase
MKSGPVSFEKGLALQDKAKTLVASGEWDGIVILLEHLPVITVGNGGGKENLRINDPKLSSEEIMVVSTNRGGNITCHNPGQLIGYPVLNLDKWRKDVHWYVHMLEEVLILTLAHYGFRAGRKSKYTGAWLADEKIAAIGVSVRRWITGHGFALNINNDLRLFELIVPCGINEFGVTNMISQGLDVDVADVSEIITTQFQKVFQCNMNPIKCDMNEVICKNGRRERH